jgi:hypothetical protein
MAILAWTTLGQLVTLFLLHKVIIRHLFSPLEYITRGIRYWLPEGRILPPEPKKKKKNGKVINKKRNQTNTTSGTVILVSKKLEAEKLMERQGFAAVDWRFSVVLCAIILFFVGETISCLWPEETTLEVSTILLCSAAFGCLDFLIEDLLRSEKSVMWNHFNVYVTATIVACAVCNAPISLFDFRFKRAIQAGNMQYAVLLHHLGLNKTDDDISADDLSTNTLQTFIFTFITANFAGLISAILLKPARMLAETYVHLTDAEYTPSIGSRIATQIDFFYPVLMIACWVPSLTSDFFTTDHLLQCDQHSILRDCTAKQSGKMNIEKVDPIEAAKLAGNDVSGHQWKFYSGEGITETSWYTIRVSIVLIGTFIKLLTGRRNVQAYLDRAHYQYDSFMASSGTATMERVTNVLQYRFRVICPNTLALFAPYGFPLCVSLILKKTNNLKFPQTCSILVDSFQYIGWSNAGIGGMNNTNSSSSINKYLDDEGKENMLWFSTMSTSSRTLVLIYLEQLLSFLLFWSLLTTFIVMSFYIISTNDKLEGVFNAPVNFVTEQIKTLGADAPKQRKQGGKNKLSGSNPKKKKNI